MKNKNRTTSLFSPMRINDYNIFLKHLDNKQEEKTLSDNLLEEELQKLVDQNKKCNETLENPMDELDQVHNMLKIIKKSFKYYDNNNIFGNIANESNSILNPNIANIDSKLGNPYDCHAKLSKEVKVKEKKNILVEIDNVSDLLTLINNYKLDEKVEYNINLEGLHNIKEPLQELNQMIGMNELKQNIVDQILYFSQNLHKNKSEHESSGDYMHTVIYGPPGTGKTEIARIMGKIYSKMGVLKNNKFRKVTRSDLIAGYLGQTTIKTRDVINDCLGGVLFIDEAYSLGNSEKRDSFSKECIDTLCEALSAHKENLMVIIAGYENELKECFFNYNQGLESRFTWRFKTEEYKASELCDIFLKKIENIGWSIDEKSKEKINVDWFQKNTIYFKYFGRDIEVLLSKIKISHSRRVFCKNAEEKTKITFHDFEKGFEMYLKNGEVKSRKEEAERKFSMSSMYL